MAHKPKPHVHGRDHEHGGADPTWTHWQDTAANTGKFGKIVFGDNLTVTPDSSDNRLIRVDATGGGGGLPSFANTCGNLSFTTDDTPLILDTPLDGSMHFYSTDPATFDISGGRARILRIGMYVIGCQMNFSFTGTTGGFTVWLKLAYAGSAGYSIEVPYYVGGFEEVTGTRYDFVEGRVYDDTDLALQRIHPISLTDNTTFPFEILPTYDARVGAAEALAVTGVGVWGFRLGDSLDYYHSD